MIGVFGSLMQVESKTSPWCSFVSFVVKNKEALRACTGLSWVEIK